MNIYLTIFPFAAFKSFRPDSDSAIELPIVRFLSAARKRREDKVSVNTISAEEWDSLYTSDEADVDENVAHEHPLSLCMIHPRQAGDRADLGKQMLLGKYNPLQQEQQRRRERVHELSTSLRGRRRQPIELQPVWYLQGRRRHASP